jgi:ankyrin repeat protein
MALDASIIGEFIDAVALDPSKAAEMLRHEPGLRDARWLHEETILHFLSIEGKAEHVRLLGEWGFDPNATNEFGDAPLIDVAVLGRDDVAGVLLDLGADPNARSVTADNVRHCAVRSGNARLVELLLSKGAKADYTTDIKETVFDALPEDPARRAAVEEVLHRHGVGRARLRPRAFDPHPSLIPSGESVRGR